MEVRDRSIDLSRDRSIESIAIDRDRSPIASTSIDHAIRVSTLSPIVARVRRARDDERTNERTNDAIDRDSRTRARSRDGRRSDDDARSSGRVAGVCEERSNGKRDKSARRVVRGMMTTTSDAIARVVLRHHNSLAKIALGAGFTYGFVYTTNVGESPFAKVNAIGGLGKNDDGANAKANAEARARTRDDRSIALSDG